MLFVAHFATYLSNFDNIMFAGDEYLVGILVASSYIYIRYVFIICCLLLSSYVRQVIITATVLHRQYILIIHCSQWRAYCTMWYTFDQYVTYWYLNNRASIMSSIHMLFYWCFVEAMSVWFRYDLLCIDFREWII